MSECRKVPSSYQEADSMLQGRNGYSRKVGNNTFLQRRGDDIALLYHSTDVVKYQPDGSLTLDSGGWRTPTTKERINWALPLGVGVFQSKGVWYLRNESLAHGPNTSEDVFADGITLRPDGAGTMSVSGEGVSTPKADGKMKKRVKAFAQLCADALPLEQPGPGDCFYCLFKGEDGQTVGDLMESNARPGEGHLDHHMEEGYIVPSLVYNALKAHYNAPAAFWGAFEGSDAGDTFQVFAGQAVKRAVYRYILRRKGFAV